MGIVSRVNVVLLSINNMSHHAKAKAYLQQLDLNFVVQRMCSPHYPLPQWSEELALTCAKLYKNFLWLICHSGQKNLVPTYDIDEFWHNHILFTREYHRDCQAIFGHYLHHVPADPNISDPNEMVSSFNLTKKLYLEVFGEPLLVLNRKILSVE